MMINHRRLSSSVRFVGSLCLAIVVALFLMDVFGTVVHGQSVNVSTMQGTTDQVAVLQKIDPECKRYDRCDQAWGDVIAFLQKELG